MGLGSCLTCVKYLLFVFNFLFWLIGCVMVALGVWMIVDPKSLGDIAPVQELSLGSYGFIAVGSVIMIVGFFGCCGAIKENQCLLVTFFICLLIIFGVLLAIGIFYIMYPEGSSKATEKVYKELAGRYYTDKIAREEVNSVHKQFNCCGHTLGTGDFTMTDLPEGCASVASALSLKKCPQAITEAVQRGAVVVAAVALGVGIVLLIGMIFSMMLCCAIRDTTA